MRCWLRRGPIYCAFLVHMCLVVWLSVSDDDNDNNRQCTMYSSVCLKDSIWQECRVTHFEMHENHRVSEDEKRLCILCNFGNVGHLVGTGVNVGLPLFLLCVGRALMISPNGCFYSRIHRGRLGLAERYKGIWQGPWSLWDLEKP